MGNDILVDVQESKRDAVGIAQKTLFLGDSNDTVAVSATSTSASAKAIRNSTLNLGLGDDVVNLAASALAGGNAHGLYATTLDLVGGSNQVNISAKSGAGHALGVEGNAVNGGSGNDQISILASTGGSGTSVGLHTTTVDMKNGNNILRVQALAANNEATGMWRSTVKGGADADTIEITAKTSGCGTARGLNYSSIYAGDGQNEVTVSAESASGKAYGIACDVIGGKDNDTFRISAKSLGNGYAEGLGGSTVDAKGGDNLISISAESATGTAYGVYSGKVLAGAGNDTISISAVSGGTGRAQGLYCTTVNAGDGDNAVDIQAISQAGDAVTVGCDVLTGSGTDTVTLTAQTSGSANAHVLYWSKLDMGQGNNSAVLNAVSGTGHALAMEKSTLLGGDSREELTLLASTGGKGTSVGVHSSTIDMKGGENTLYVKASTQDNTATGVWQGKIYGSSGAGGEQSPDGITIIGQSSGTGNAYGVTDCSLIDMKGGPNTLSISALAANGHATALNCCSTVLGGNDSDTINILARTNGASSVARGLSYSSIDAKNGANYVSIAAEAVNGAAYGIACEVTGGSDKDIFTISAKTSGSGYAEGMGGSVVDAKDGDNVISVLAQSGTGKAYAVYSGGVRAGAGNDDISISAISGGAGRAQALYCTTVNAGEGNNSVAIEAASQTGEACAVGCDVLAGGGNDTMLISAKTSGAAVAHGLYYSKADAGNGNNSVTVSAESLGGHALAMEKSTLRGGSGDDVFALRATSTGTGSTVAVHSSTVDMKDGTNSLVIESITVNNDASGMWNSTIYGGSGADEIAIYATATGTGKAKAIDVSSIYAGDGANKISLAAASQGGESYAIGCDVIGGKDNDTFVISASTLGAASAGALWAGVVDLKGGQNSLNVSASVADGEAYGVGCGHAKGTVYGGAGVDVMSISAQASGSGTAFALKNGSVHGMAGDDQLTVTASAALGSAHGVAAGTKLDGNDGNDQMTVDAYSASGNAYAVSGIVHSGAGNDVIRVTAASGNANALATTLQGGVIDGSGGNDDITLATNGVLNANKAGYVYGGDGNDVVHLIHNGPAGAGNFTQDGAYLAIEGGYNNAVSHASVNGGSAFLGDILALEQGYANTAMLGKLPQLTIKSFEGLLLDFSNGLDDGASLDAMLGATKSLRASNAGLSLIIKGDEGVDNVMANGLLQNLKHSDVAIDGISHDAHGNDVTFSHYTADFQNTSIDVYLQSGIGIA